MRTPHRVVRVSVLASCLAVTLPGGLPSAVLRGGDQAESGWQAGGSTVARVALADPTASGRREATRAHGQQPGTYMGFRVGRYEGQMVNALGNVPGKAQLDLLSISTTGAVRAHLREFDGLEGEGDLTGAISTAGVLQLRGAMRSPSDGSVWQSATIGVLVSGAMRFGQRLTLNGQEQQETATLAFTGAPTIAATGQVSPPAPARTPREASAPARAPAAAPAAAPPGGAPQPGVYACYGQRGPALPAQFGIIDGRTYANFDAETGRYVLANGILTMTTGPMAGFKYRHTQSTPTDVFRLLDEQGAFTAYNCPWQRGDARRGHW